MNIISGEKFISIADFIFVNQDKVNFHKTLFNFCTKDKLIYFNNNFEISFTDLTKINKYKLPCLYVYSDHLLNFCKNVLDKINVKIKLIVHNSDENVTFKYIEYLNDDKIVAMFSQNIDINHPKLHYLPIGIANSQWSHGNLNVLNTVMNIPIQKNNLVYFNFTINDSYKTRPYLYQLLINKGFEYIQNKSISQYLMTMAQYKFAFSPNGGGIDCHRTWEALYLGVIPIMEKSVLSDKLVMDYPILVVEDWNIITNEFLEEQYKLIKSSVYDKTRLDYNYFKELIMEK